MQQGHTIEGDHCEACGAADPMALEGYTECCNQLICNPASRSEVWAVGTMAEWPATDHTKTDTARGCCSAAIARTLPAGTAVLWRESSR